MQKFIIGTDDFGIGEITCDIDKEKSIINELTIVGDEQTFKKLSSDGDGEWSWILYPPKVYLMGVPFEMKEGKISITINEGILENSDVALYLMEHNNIEGTLTIDENDVLRFQGVTDISGKETKLDLEVNIRAK